MREICLIYCRLVTVPNQIIKLIGVIFILFNGMTLYIMYCAKENILCIMFGKKLNEVLCIFNVLSGTSTYLSRLLMLAHILPILPILAWYNTRTLYIYIYGEEV